MKFGSLFSGIGGFDLGFERAGMQCAWQCEIDDKCRGVLKRHWPEVTVYDDVRSIGRGVETVDLVCGGFPCQDLSVAGRRAGLAGERSGLWYEFHRVLATLRPEWCVIENVPGLLSSNRGRDFAILLSGLADIGYLSAWRVLDAQYFGLAQRRKRVFIVGCTRDGRAAEVLFEREGLSRHPPSRGTARETVAGSLGGGSGERGWADDTDRMTFVTQAAVAGCLQERDAKGPDSDTKPGHLIVTTHALTSEGADASEDGTGRGTPLVFDTTQVTSAANYSSPKAGDPYHPLASGAHPPAVAYGLELAHQGSGGNAGYHTLDKPARTLDSSAPGNAGSGCGVRRLTPTECERLQGFPDGWTDGQSDSARYRQLGNAVAVPVAEWIGRRIMEVAG